MASNAHVSIDLNEYLLETLAISIRCPRLASREVTMRSSGGLSSFKYYFFGRWQRLEYVQSIESP